MGFDTTGFAVGAQLYSGSRELCAPVPRYGRHRVCHLRERKTVVRRGRTIPVASNSGKSGSISSGGSDHNIRGRYPGYDPREQDPKSIRWTDKVALQAQVGSALDTLEVILEALRNNKAWADVGLPGDTRRKDEGLEALYTFANFDVWSLRANFFGRSLDLGQFERFKRVMVSSPYDIILAGEYEVLSQFKPAPDRYSCRVLFRAPHHDDTVFNITMSRVATGLLHSWMMDSLIHDPTPFEPPPEALSEPSPESNP